jgi:membrane protease YdiL (CAAX protease family)
MTSAVTLVTLLFVASHLPEVWGYPPAMVAVGALGVAALYARIRTQSLVSAVALHAAYNLALALAVHAGGA